MDDPLVQLSDQELTSIATALKSERLSPPFRSQGLQRFVDGSVASQVADALQLLTVQGFNPSMLATVIQLLLSQREAITSNKPEIELVTSGPEAAGTSNRDTAIVVRELFARANRSVLVVGYAVFQGRRVFEALAERMRDLPDLGVTMCLEISRDRQEVRPAEIVLSRFLQRFKDSQWPTGYRLPEIYYDPRSIGNGIVRSSLHAKIIVIDRHKVFLSSANFTEAAQERNIEAGLMLDSRPLAEKVCHHFEALIQSRALHRVI